jgi:transcriptional regulator with XRE-family HTH domain
MSRTLPRRRRRYPTLAAYLAKSGDTQVGVARAVGTSQAHISRIAAGLTMPQPELAVDLAAYCRIPLDSFIKVRHAVRVALQRIA